jgi:hypothetical protein
MSCRPRSGLQARPDDFVISYGWRISQFGEKRAGHVSHVFGIALITFRWQHMLNLSERWAVRINLYLMVGHDFRKRRDAMHATVLCNSAQPRAAGAARLFGVSMQDTSYQREAVERLPQVAIYSCRNSGTE